MAVAGRMAPTTTTVLSQVRVASRVTAVSSSVSVPCVTTTPSYSASGPHRALLAILEIMRTMSSVIEPEPTLLTCMPSMLLTLRGGGARAKRRRSARGPLGAHLLGVADAGRLEKEADALEQLGHGVDESSDADRARFVCARGGREEGGSAGRSGAARGRLDTRPTYSW